MGQVSDRMLARALQVLRRGPSEAESEPVVSEAGQRRVRVQVRDVGPDLRRRGGARQGPGDSAQLILFLCNCLPSMTRSDREHQIK